MEESFLLAPEAVLNEYLLASVNQRTFSWQIARQINVRRLFFASKTQSIDLQNETQRAFQVQGILARVIANL